MPLHALVYINDHELDPIHIGRLEGDENPDTINTYIVVVGTRPLVYEDWLNGTKFTHRYGDGALTCLKKAIEAYELRTV